MPDLRSWQRRIRQRGITDFKQNNYTECIKATRFIQKRRLVGVCVLNFALKRATTAQPCGRLPSSSRSQRPSCCPYHLPCGGEQKQHHQQLPSRLRSGGTGSSGVRTGGSCSRAFDAFGVRGGASVMPVCKHPVATLGLHAIRWIRQHQKKRRLKGTYVCE